jgi:hypothetical protein
MLIFMATVLLHPIRYLEEASQLLTTNIRTRWMTFSILQVYVPLKKQPTSSMAKFLQHIMMPTWKTSSATVTPIDEGSFQTFLFKTTPYHKMTSPRFAQLLLIPSLLLLKSRAFEFLQTPILLQSEQLDVFRRSCTMHEDKGRKNVINVL